MRIANITTQTLKFHRQSTHARQTSLNDVLDGVLILFQGKIAAAEVVIQRRYRTEQPILAFEGDLRQVFANLLSNAIDASAPGTRIVCRISEGRDEKTGKLGVRATIADSGHGMSTGTVARMFEAFFTTKEMHGTGLGLWVSAGILQNHRATARVRSSQNAVGHGTIFSLFFPLDGAEAA